MLSKLKNNKLFLILTPVLAFAGFGIMLPFNYDAYINWTVWQMVLIDILSGLCIITAAFWSSVILCDDKKKLLITTAVISAVICLFYFLGGGLAIWFAKKTTAIFFGLVSATVFMVALLFYTVATLTIKKKNKKIMLSCSAVFVAAVLIACSMLVTVIPGSSTTEMPVIKEFRISDTLEDGHNEKVKVILVNGQSNATGVARVSYLEQKLAPEDFARYKKGYDNVYVNYITENGNNSSHGSFVHAGFDMGATIGYFGPELAIADKLSQAYPDEKIFIIKYSWGGSCLATQWFAPDESGKEGELYTAFINFTTACMEYLRSKNYDASIGAMCWMQGESDSFDELASQYYENQKAMVTNLRSRLAPYALDGQILFVDGGISNSPYWTNYETINEGKQRFAQDNPVLNKYFSTLDLSYSTEPIEEPDKAHYDSTSEITLGNRFADEIIAYYATK